MRKVKNSKEIEKAKETKSVVYSEHFQGPLPHPDILYKYSQINSDIPNKIIAMAEEQSKARLENEKKWDIFELNVDIKTAILNFYKETQGSKYDWLGILLSNIFNFHRHNKDKYTCSEWVSTIIDRELNIIVPKNYYQITPQDIYEILKFHKII